MFLKFRLYQALIILFLLAAIGSVYAQFTEQKWMSSQGEAGEEFGRSLAIDTSVAIVGQYRDGINGLLSGSAFIFRKEGDTWVEEAWLVPSDGDTADRFGRGVSISGNYAVVGAHIDEDVGNGAGSAYIFKYDGETWNEELKLTASDADTGDHFGVPSIISGNYIIIGAPDDNDNGFNSGSAYIFKREGDSWIEQAKLTASDGEANDEFGVSVDISGDYAVVGAWKEDANGTDAGAAYIFKRDGETWSEQAKLTASDADVNDAFGFQSSISGDYALVGASLNFTGAAYVFKREDDIWIEQAKLAPESGQSLDSFGFSSEISGNYAIIGSWGYDGLTADEGIAYIFRRNGELWHEHLSFQSSDIERGDEYAYAVAMFGENALVGVYQDQENGGSRAGSAYLYTGYVTDVFFVDSTILDFGEITTIDTATRVLTIANNGLVPLNVGPISLGGTNPASFSIDTSSFTLMPGDAELLDVRFFPTSAGSFSALVTIDSDSGIKTVDLLGIAKANEPPVVSVIPGQTVVEGSGFDPIVLDDFVDDPDHDDTEISWSFSGNVELSVTIDSIRRVDIVVPHKNWNGSETITFLATDPGGLMDSSSAVFDNIPVNDAPIITDQVTLTTGEDTSITLDIADLTIDDPDNVYPDDFTLTLYDSINYTFAGTTVTPDSDYNGDLSVPVSVNDGLEESEIFNLTVTVTSTNDIVQISGQLALSTEEETALEIKLTDLIVSDPDNIYPDDFSLTVIDSTNYTVAGTAITPDLDFTGNLVVPVSVNDGTDESNIYNLSISVDAVNDIPMIVGQATLSTPEETSLALSLADLSVTDPDNTYPADFSLTVQPGTNYTFSGNIITPGQDFNGDLTVLVLVNDGTDDSEIYDLIVTVTPLNDIPQIEDQVEVNTLEETELQITLADLIVNDPDDTYPDDFTLSVQDSINYTRNGNNITPDTEFNGVLNVPVLVNDGLDNSDPFNLTVAVFAVNDIPVISGQSALSVQEESDLILSLADLSVNDPDNSFPVDFSLTVLDGFDYTHSGNTITPLLDFNGQLSVPVIVNDGIDDSDIFNLTITVSAVNDKPVIVSHGSLSTPEETSLELTLADITVSDPDNVFPDDFSLFVQGGADYTHQENIITPAIDFSGILTVPVLVNDGTDTSDIFNVLVNVTSENDLPEITGQQALSTPEEIALTITLDDLIVNDPDNTYPDDFSILVQDGENYTRDNTAITPVLDFNGNLSVPVSVNDGTNLSNIYDLSINVTAVNDIPVITAQQEINTPEETAVEITLSHLTVSDPDNVYPDEFVLTVHDGKNYTIQRNIVLPEIDFSGNLTVPVSVNDGMDESTNFDLTITVSSQNDPPLITEQTALEIPEDMALTITLDDLTVTDPDNSFPDDFTLTVGDGENYNRNNATITPVANYSGDLSVPVSVNDGFNESNIFDLAVSVTAVNDPPVITTEIQAQEISEGNSFSSINLDDHVTDVDDTDSSLIWTFSGNLDLGISISENNIAEITVPDAEWHGSEVLTFIVADPQGLTDSSTATFTIDAVNDPPQILDVPSILSFNEDDSLLIDLSEWYTFIDDPDNPDSSLLITFIGFKNITLNPDSSGLIMKAPQDWYGADTLTLIVSDGFLADSIDISVLIRPINDAPQFISLPAHLSFQPDSSLSLPMNQYIHDVETPDSLLQWQFEADNDSLLIDYEPVSALLTLSAPLFSGSVELYITVTDDSAARVDDTLTVNVGSLTSLGDLPATIIPESFIIYQNYPNPFNPLTRIKFGMPHAGFVRLEIYNILGQNVYTLWQGVKQAGYHILTFDASQLPSGIYFYRMQAENFNTIKKMVLVK